MRRLLREPLLHFMLLGALIFVVYQWRQGGGQGDTLVVPQATVDMLVSKYRKTWLREPTRDEVQQAVEQHVANQLFAEQAFEMGMHLDDPVVARRMRMKMELLNDLTVTPPTESEVSAYFEKNKGKYSRGVTYTFQHRYFGSDIEADKLKAIAAKLAESGDVNSAPSLFSDRYADTSDIQVARAFGSAFVEQLAPLTLNTWHGPLSSPLGWHFVNVTERVEAEPPSLEAVYQQVERDALNKKREQVGQAQLQALLASKTITIEWPEALK